MEPLDDGSNPSIDMEVATPLSEVKENIVELYPCFFFPLRKDVRYTVSARFDLETSFMFNGLKIQLKNMQQTHKRMAYSFNGKTLTVCGWPNDPLIGGFRMA
jgi:hypothetical protein